MTLINDPTLVGRMGRRRRAPQNIERDPLFVVGDATRGGKYNVPGLTQTNPAQSVRALIEAYPEAPSGAYWFQFNPSWNVFRCYVENTIDGGGWLLAAQTNFEALGSRNTETQHPLHYDNAWWRTQNAAQNGSGILGIGDIYHPNQDVGTQAWGQVPLREVLVCSSTPGGISRGVIYRFSDDPVSEGSTAAALVNSGTVPSRNTDLRIGRNPYAQQIYKYVTCRSDTTWQPLGSSHAGFNYTMDAQPHGYMRLGSGQTDSTQNETGMGIGNTYGYGLSQGHQWGFGWSRNSSLWNGQNRDEWTWGVQLFVR